MNNQNELKAGQFMVIVDLTDKEELVRVGALDYAYTDKFNNGLFMVFTQHKTDTVPYCQYAVNIDTIIGNKFLFQETV